MDSIYDIISEQEKELMHIHTEQLYEAFDMNTIMIIIFDCNGNPIVE